MESRGLSSKELGQLLKFVSITSENELTCDEWLDRVNAYADAVSAGLPPPAGSELLTQHLDVCHECQEEFDALMQALRDKSE